MFEKSAQASETIFIAVVALLVLYEIVRWNIPWTRWRVIRIVLGVFLLFGLFLARLKYKTLPGPCYDYYLQASDCFTAFNTSFSSKDLFDTRRLVQQSLAVDGSYARSYALLVQTHEAAWVNPVDSDFLFLVP